MTKTYYLLPISLNIEASFPVGYKPLFAGLILITLVGPNIENPTKLLACGVFLSRICKKTDLNLINCNTCHIQLDVYSYEYE
jgi:hypothetical protein